MPNTTVENNFQLMDSMAHPPHTSTSLVGAPNISMRITDQKGGDVLTARVGDPLALRFQIEDRGSPYQIFVRELVAMDGRDASEILLIDSIGDHCSVNISKFIRTISNHL